MPRAKQYPRVAFSRAPEPGHMRKGRIRILAVYRRGDRPDDPFKYVVFGGGFQTYWTQFRDSAEDMAQVWKRLKRKHREYQMGTKR